MENILFNDENKDDIEHSLYHLREILRRFSKKDPWKNFDDGTLAIYACLLGIEYELSRLTANGGSF